MYSKNDAKVVLFVLIYKQKTGLFDVCLKYIAYLCAFLKNLEMTKAELCKSISAKTGCDAQTVLAVVESLMVEVKESLEKGENVYLRGFGSFIVKQRAEKTARNISKNTTVIVPAHNIPAFKPAKEFVKLVSKLEDSWLFAKDNHKSESENGSLLWFFLTWAFALLYFNSFQ